MGKESKEGITVLVTSNAAGEMLPFQAITSGTTHRTLLKFVENNEGFNQQGGGVARRSAKTGKLGKTLYTTDELGNAAPSGPPFFKDAATGHVMCAGGSTHWTTVPTLKLWVTDSVYPQFRKVCAEKGLDPEEQCLILLIDAYSVHVSEEFREWLKAKYPKWRILFVPAGCTSKLQLADVLLNKPLKGWFSQLHIEFLMGELRRLRAAGTALKDVRFAELATAAAGPALKWLVSAYKKAEGLNQDAALKRIGLPQCWDPEFRAVALTQATELLEEKLPEVVEDMCDIEDDIVLGLAEADAVEQELELVT